MSWWLSALKRVAVTTYWRGGPPRPEERVKDAGLAVETILKHGDPDAELAALARDVDTVLVGRRGRSSPADVLGKTVTSLIRIAERSVIVCASKPSPMSACAIAYDGRETAQRALALVARFASVTHSTVHVIHATVDPAIGTMVIGEAEAMLSLQGVAFVTRSEEHTSELQSPCNLVCRLLLEKKKKKYNKNTDI